MYIKKKNLKHLLIDKNKSINEVLIVLNKSQFPEKKVCIVIEKLYRNISSTWFSLFLGLIAYFRYPKISYRLFRWIAKGDIKNYLTLLGIRKKLVYFFPITNHNFVFQNISLSFLRQFLILIFTLFWSALTELLVDSCELVALNHTFGPSSITLLFKKKLLLT